MVTHSLLAGYVIYGSSLDMLPKLDGWLCWLSSLAEYVDYAAWLAVLTMLASWLCWLGWL
jgi:hypothetical protein